MAHESDASMSTLLRNALDDVRELFREEVALARAELRAEVSKAASAASGFGAAAAALVCAGLFLLTALALGIATLMEWPAWTGFAIVGVVLRDRRRDHVHEPPPPWARSAACRGRSKP